MYCVTSTSIKNDTVANVQNSSDITGPKIYPHSLNTYGTAKTPEPNVEFTKLKIQDAGDYFSVYSISEIVTCDSPASVSGRSCSSSSLPETDLLIKIKQYNI